MGIWLLKWLTENKTGDFSNTMLGVLNGFISMYSSFVGVVLLVVKCSSCAMLVAGWVLFSGNLSGGSFSCV